MEEYHDALQRGRRLAVSREAALAGSESAMSVVKMEDLLVYTRWMVWYMHSVKRIHAFLRVSASSVLHCGRPYPKIQKWHLCGGYYYPISLLLGIFLSQKSSLWSNPVENSATTGYSTFYRRAPYISSLLTFIHSLTHSLTCLSSLLTHLFTQSLSISHLLYTYSLIPSYSLTHSLTHLPTYLFSHLVIGWLT